MLKRLEFSMILFGNNVDGTRNVGPLEENVDRSMRCWAVMARFTSQIWAEYVHDLKFKQSS